MSTPCFVAIASPKQPTGLFGLCSPYHPKFATGGAWCGRMTTSSGIVYRNKKRSRKGKCLRLLLVWVEHCVTRRVRPTSSKQDAVCKAYPRIGTGPNTVIAKDMNTTKNTTNLVRIDRVWSEWQDLNLRPLPPQNGKNWKYFLLSWIISRYRLLFYVIVHFLSDIVVPEKCTFGA